jgi:hypothetical protein
MAMFDQCSTSMDGRNLDMETDMTGAVVAYPGHPMVKQKANKTL